MWTTHCPGPFQLDPLGSLLIQTIHLLHLVNSPPPRKSVNPEYSCHLFMAYSPQSNIWNNSARESINPDYSYIGPFKFHHSQIFWTTLPLSLYVIHETSFYVYQLVHPQMSIIIWTTHYIGPFQHHHIVRPLIWTTHLIYRVHSPSIGVSVNPDYSFWLFNSQPMVR